jgi:hypothetical protein
MIESVGYVFSLYCLLTGIVSAEGFLTFPGVAIGLGMLLSVTSSVVRRSVFYRL